MGFLKSIFEKKKGKLDDDDIGGGVVGRSHSEFFHPPSQKPAHSAQAIRDDSSQLADLRSNIGQAKSFTFVQKRARSSSKDEHSTAHSGSRLAESRPQYSDITQFTQKVELYRGSVATVFKAVCLQSQAKVIIKAYRKAKMQAKHLHKMHREIVVMKMLSGPYVTEFYDTFEDEHHVYIIMEYCEGGDLFKTMLMNGGLLDEHWVCVEIIAPILRILEKMHALKIMHRDIKPENIFLTRIGKFKLGDFGLAILFEEEIPFSRSGTLDYMAPEVLRNPHTQVQESKQVDQAMLDGKGVKPYTTAVDVWAVGVLAYELVCGRPPFEVDDEAQTAALIMYSDNIKFPSQFSSQWADFVRHALIKKPENRPSAAELLHHNWCRSHLQQSLSADAGGNRRITKEMLLQPLPLHSSAPDIPLTSTADRKLRPSSSFAATSATGGTAAAPARPLDDISALRASLVEASSKPATPPSTPPKMAQLQHSQSQAVREPPPMRKSSKEDQRNSPSKLGPKGLQISVPPTPTAVQQVDYEASNGCDTPVGKPGMKQRMKFYFQRQAGGV